MYLARFLLTAFLCLICGCAYYNTFYNARKAYQEGERIRLTQSLPDGRIPPQATEAYQRAIENAGLVLRDHSGSSLVDDALVLIGNAEAVQGQHRQAIGRFNQVRDHFPDSEFRGYCLFALGRSYLGAADSLQAEEHLDRYIQQFPEDDWAADAYLLWAGIALGNGRYGEAVTRFSSFLEKYPGNDRYAEALFYVAQSKLELNYFTEARTLFTEVMNRSKSREITFRADFMIGKSLQREGDPAAALNVYSALLEEGAYDEFHPQVMLASARSLRSMQREIDAIARYETLISQYASVRDYEEEVSQALFEMGGLYQTRGELELAEQRFNDARRHSPRNFWVREESDRKSRAINELRRLNRNLENMAAALASMAPGPDAATGPRTDHHDDPNVIRLKENLVGLRFQLAEHYLFNLEMPDSALTQYQAIEIEALNQSLAGKAAFATAWIHGQYLGNTEAEHSYYGEIIEKYPGVSYASEAALRLNRPVTGVLSDERMFSKAENLLFESDLPDSARHWYALVIERYPDGEYAPKAMHVLGWLDEHYYGSPQKAIDRYKLAIERYPQSSTARALREKIRLMEAILVDHDE